MLKQIDKIVKDALVEDIGKQDITTSAIVPVGKVGCAEIIAKESCVIAGLFIADHIIKKFDKKANFLTKIKEGDKVKNNTKIAQIEATLSAILTTERVMLNFLQRLSGIATLTSKYVSLAYPMKVLDTRKTTPNLRILEKYAVKVGGGLNHRFGLYDAILIKDNHIKIAGSITEAVRRVRRINPTVKIEIETENLNQVEEVVGLNVDTIMLDNMSIKNIRDAVKIINKETKIEVSGGINLDNIKKIAKTEVDFISIGALTHSAKAVDISLKIK